MQPHHIEPAKRVVRMIDAAMRLYDQHVSPAPAHGNERLHLRGVVGVLLACTARPTPQRLRRVTVWDRKNQCELVLLTDLQTGLRVSKYALLWVGWVATGRASPERMAEAMARHERERDRQRRAKKPVV